MAVSPTAAIAGLQTDLGWNEVAASEAAYIAAWRSRRAGCFVETPSDYRPTGLALSGGGIRSAVYCLGVLQRLAQERLLERFDYLSTVSGGGYIGAALTWFLHHPTKAKQFDCADRLPFGTDDPADMPRPPREVTPLLRHLRQHGSYLVPGNGITIWSGIAVVLRGLLLNLLIWIPVTAMVLAALSVVSDLVLQLTVLSPRDFLKSETPSLALFDWIAAGLGALFVLASLGYSFISGRPRHGGSRPGGIRYNSRRRFEVLLKYFPLAVPVFLLIGTLPAVVALSNDYLVNSVTVGSLLTGAGTVMGLWTRFSDQPADRRLQPRLIAPVGAMLVLYGVLLIAWSFAARARMDPETYGAVLVGVGVVALASARWVNLNYLTLHRYYRDRLMEAFMPDLDEAGQKEGAANAFTPSHRALSADNGWLKNMADQRDPRGPYHLINTHVVLNDTKDPKLHQRGGDSFILSPCFCGSATTGWKSTKTFMRGEMSLATAMAISGAAVNPNAASAGVGPQRQVFVSLLMSLLNVRLGCWVPNVRQFRQDDRPTHLTALNEYIGFGCNESSWHHLLTDGGHFDNLGVYELIRRRARFVLACDATADPAFAFADLQNLLVRVDADFGAKIEFEEDEPLACLIPQTSVSYPHETKLARRPFIVGKIVYDKKRDDAEPDTGVFIYLTTVMTEQLRLQLYGFKGANPTFPDETTANQFFDEARFEAYRELGFKAADLMLKDAAPQALFAGIVTEHEDSAVSSSPSAVQPATTQSWRA